MNYCVLSHIILWGGYVTYCVLSQDHTVGENMCIIVYYPKIILWGGYVNYYIKVILSFTSETTNLNHSPYCTVKDS